MGAGGPIVPGGMETNGQSSLTATIEEGRRVARDLSRAEGADARATREGPADLGNPAILDEASLWAALSLPFKNLSLIFFACLSASKSLPCPGGRSRGTATVLVRPTSRGPTRGT